METLQGSHVSLCFWKETLEVVATKKDILKNRWQVSLKKSSIPSSKVRFLSLRRELIVTLSLKKLNFPHLQCENNGEVL